MVVFSSISQTMQTEHYAVFGVFFKNAVFFILQCCIVTSTGTKRSYCMETIGAGYITSAVLNIFVLSSYHSL